MNGRCTSNARAKLIFRVRLVGLRLWLWRLQLLLCWWSGFYEGAEYIL
jgi:hypothetical protein